MPLAKKKVKGGKKNQGAQWGDTGSPGNIKTIPEAGSTDKGGTPRSAVSSKHGRNKSIGRDKGGRRSSPGN